MAGRKSKSHLLGLGLDGDGEKRITRAENFSIVGGSEETHEKIAETFIKTCEDLKRKGRDLDDADPRETANGIGQKRYAGDVAALENFIRKKKATSEKRTP